MSVPKPENDHELEEMLTATFGPPPCADVDAWRQRYPSALAWLNPPPKHILSQRRKYMQRVILLAATTAAAVCALIGISHLGTNSTGASAFAQTVDQIQKARNMTFRVTFHSLATGHDDKQWTELHTIQRAVKEPGVWRSTVLNKDGQIEDVQLLDFIRGRELRWSPRTKKAVLREMEPAPKFQAMREYLKDKLAVRDWQFVKKQDTPTGAVNVFRHTFKETIQDPYHKEGPTERDSSYEVWIDERTKKLVKMQIPGADVYDLDQHPARDPSPEARSRSAAMGLVYSDFAFDVDLDDSLFSFEPPDGYAVEKHDYPQVTEEDILDYLGLFAKCRGQFPDQVSQFPFFPIDWVNEIMNKKDATPIEKRFLKRHFFFDKVNQKPFTRFAESNTEPNSFRYLGKGVKLGDKDAIVCWYKLKNVKNHNRYRVLYGDLSVKDIPAKDLPLPVGP